MRVWEGRRIAVVVENGYELADTPDARTREKSSRSSLDALRGRGAHPRAEDATTLIGLLVYLRERS